MKTNDSNRIKKELLEEWDYELNSVNPEDVAPYSNKYINWVCKKCGYKWKSVMASRTRGSGCPVCANQVVWKGHNDLETIYPKLAKEWDYKKNGKLKPSDFVAKSSKVVWWYCKKCKNNWQSSIHDRKGRPCPRCNSLVGTSESEQTIYFYLKKNFKNTINRYRNTWIKPYQEIDIYIPELNLAIEYDGKQWHKSKDKDIKKSNHIISYGVDLVRFRELGLPVLNVDCKIIEVKSYDTKSLEKGIKELINYINKKYNISLEIDINIEKDRQQILKQYKKELSDKSLDNGNYPVAKEWNFERNNGLLPSQFYPYSSHKVWWKCSCCGYEYQAKIATRTIDGKKSCPFCSGKVVIKGVNDFATVRPELMAEWDFDKNKISPYNVTSQSGKKVWWKCKICGRTWNAAIHDRTVTCRHKNNS